VLEKLIEIDPSKECLEFLYDRILDINYRGIQISQHNRYTYEQVVGMLSIMYDLVGTNKMVIRTTDLKKRPHNTYDELTYAKYTTLVNEKYGKGTQDSIRKNLFVDFHRMGLIYRYSLDGKHLNPYARKTVKSVSLTPLALDLINSEISDFDRYLLFTRALDNLLKGLATDFFDILAELDYLTIDEYTFFISFLRQPLNGKYTSMEEVIKYVNQYRSLSKFQKDAVVRVVKEYCNPDDFAGDKTNKRDFHNWRNESQQVFMILNMTAYYQYNSSRERLEFMVSPNNVFKTKDDVTKLKRSINEKHIYFKKHKLQKELGFELHHIVPLLWARNVTEFFLLDKWENMLYLDGKKHAIITQSGNRHVKLSFNDMDNNIILRDSSNDAIKLLSGTNVLYNFELKQILSDTNKDILESFK